MSGVGPLLSPTAFTAVEAEDVRTWTEFEDELDSRYTYQLAYIEDKSLEMQFSPLENPLFL
jgi:aminopeptidase N